MKDKLKKYLLPNLPYLFFVYLFDKLCQAVRLAPGLDASEKLLHIGQGFQTAFASSAPSFHVLDICVGIFGAILVRLAVYLKAKNAKKYRRGVEYGSARWGRPEDIAPYKVEKAIEDIKRELEKSNDVSIYEYEVFNDVIEQIEAAFTENFKHSNPDVTSNESRHKIAHGHAYQAESEGNSLKKFLYLNELYSLFLYLGKKIQE